MIVETGKIYLRKVRATSGEQDRLSLQLRLSHALSAADLHPPGLPATAIVCIRRFRDPLPGSLRLHQNGTPPPHAWEQAAKISLNQLVERASYPAREAVPPNAEAVMFADHAEMLSCLASDWCEGIVAERWWWKGLLRGRDIGRLLVPTWLDSPGYIPAALHHLERKDKAVRFVRALRADEVQAILRSIIRCFGLYALQFLDGSGAQQQVQSEQVQESIPTSSSLLPPLHIQNKTLPRTALAASHPMSKARSISENSPVQQHWFQSAPWHPWLLNQTSSELSPERQSLLGIGLMLMRAPAVLRSASFARAAQEWWRARQHMSSNKTSSPGTGSTVEVTPLQQQTSLGSDHPSIVLHEAQITSEQARENHLEYPYTAEDETSDSGKVAALLERRQFTRSEAKPSFQRIKLFYSKTQESSVEESQIPLSLPQISAPVVEGPQFPQDPRSLSQKADPRVEKKVDAQSLSQLPVPAVEESQDPLSLSELADSEVEKKVDAQSLSQLPVPTVKESQDPFHPSQITDSEVEDRQDPLHPSESLTRLSNTKVREMFEDPQDPLYPSESDEASLVLATAAIQKQSGMDEPFEAEIETELGGLFYLINLGLFLNLYGDFTTPLQPGITLSIWDFITLLGQQMLGVPVKADQVWGLLARLAGRTEQDLPGRDFDPPESWRIPAEWLESFTGEGSWRWAIDADRLQLQHPGQFLLLDLPLEGGDAEEQLKREMLDYTDLQQHKVLLERDLFHRDDFVVVAALPPKVERWLGWLMPYVWVRLQRALGLANADDVPSILCKHTARIFLTATHLDIVLSLAELPIEVRLSGLDRNPGWVPAAGRFIAFHFE